MFAITVMLGLLSAAAYSVYKINSTVVLVALAVIGRWWVCTYAAGYNDYSGDGLKLVDTLFVYVWMLSPIAAAKAVYNVATALHKTVKA